MYRRDVIVIGASAGGVRALQEVVGAIAADLRAAILIVLHIPPHTQTHLAEILDRAGPLHAAEAIEGEPVVPGRIYVAGADRHLMLEAGRIRLTRGPKENRVRPAIDVLFRSAAYAFGPRVIGVVLTGMLDDGTAGLWAIKDRGGVVIVQSPAEAQHSSMPKSALEHVRIDHTANLSQMSALLERLTSEQEDATVPLPPDSLRIETQISLEGNALRRGVMDLGKVSPNTCPACGGVLVTIREGSILRFRCHTGHAFSLKTLIAEVNEKIDDTLWSAMRAGEERSLLLKQMEELARAMGDQAVAERYAKGADESTQRSQHIRELVLSERGSDLTRETERATDQPR